MALTKTQVSELYVSIFNRASEGKGNTFWQTQGTAAEVADEMLGTDAAKEYFGDALDSDADFVEHIYANTLNKAGAGVDAEGKQYWVDMLAAGTTRGEMVAEMVKAIAAYAPGGEKYDADDAETVAAYNQFTNRVAVSDYTADTLETIAVADIDSTLSFGSALTVTDDAATVDSAKEDVDAAVPADGETFTLTTSATDDLTGTADNDLFEGAASGLVSEDTLQATDKIDGGAGDSDTFKLALDKNFDGFTGSNGITNVETVTLDGTGARTFDATGIVGATTYNLNSTTNIDISDIDTLGTVNVNGAQEDTTVAFKATTVSGTSDSVTLGLKDVGAAKDGATAQVNPDITMVSVENVTVESTGTNFVDLSSTAAKTLAVTGSGDITIDGVNAAVTSFDASAASGKVDVNLDAATLAADATITGGTGSEDNVTLKGTATTTTGYNLSGFESITVDNTAVMSYVGTDTAGLEKIIVTAANTDGTTNDATATFSAMGADALTVEATGATNDAATISADNTGAITLDLLAATANITAKTAATPAEADYTFSKTTDLTINSGAYNVVGATGGITTAADDDNDATITAAKATSFTLNVASGLGADGTTERSSFMGDISAAAATSFTVNAEGKIDSTILADLATTATITTGKTASQLTLEADKLNDLTLTANGNLDLDVSNAAAIQTANITLNSAKLVTTLDNDFAKAGTLNITGSVDDSSTTDKVESSSIVLDAIGHEDNAYDLTVTASGLDGAVTVGDNTAGTEGIKLGDIKSGKAITLNLADVVGEITTGNIGTAGKNTNVTFTSTSSKGDILTGAVVGTGAIAMTANAVGDVELGDIASAASAADAGKSVTLDLSSSKGYVKVGTIGATNAVEETVSVTAISTHTVTAVADVTIGNILATGDVEVTTATKSGEVLIGDIDTKGDITITDTSASTVADAAFTVGDINAGTQGITVGGDVSIDLSENKGGQKVGAINGDNVTLDSSIDTSTTAQDIGAHTSATITGDNLAVNKYKVNHTAAEDAAGTAVSATDLTVDYTGGALADTLTAVATTTTTSITVTGDMGAGTGANGVVVTNTGAVTDATVDISGLTNYETAAITASNNAETITLGSGEDTIISSVQAVTAIDTLVEFTAGANGDVIEFSVGASTAATGFHNTGVQTGTFAEAIADADTAAIALEGAALSTGDVYTFGWESKTYLAVEVDGNAGFLDGTDFVVEITGTVVDDLVADNFSLIL